MTIRRKDFLGDEVLTEGDLEAYCQDNSVIKCDYVSELDSLPSSVNAAYVVETKLLYIKGASDWKSMSSIDYVAWREGVITADVEAAKAQADLGVWNAAVAKNRADDAYDLATLAAVNGSDTPRVTRDATGGTTSLKVYHRTIVTALVAGPFVLIAKLPLPEYAMGDYVTVTANVGDNVGGLLRGQSLQVLKIEGSFAHAIWSLPHTLEIPGGSDVGTNVRVNYAAFYV